MSGVYFDRDIGEKVAVVDEHGDLGFGEGIHVGTDWRDHFGGELLGVTGRCIRSITADGAADAPVGAGANLVLEVAYEQPLADRAGLLARDSEVRLGPAEQTARLGGDKR